MGTFDIPQVEPEAKTTAVGGESLENIKRLRAGDGSWRFEGGALIISDESGIDRVLIGYQKDGF